MDPFTERILQRARERQKKLLESTAEQVVSPLRESNSRKSRSSPVIASPEENLPELKHSKRKEVVSESNLCDHTIADSFARKGTVSEGNVPKFVRQNSKIRIASDSPDSSPFHLKTLNFHKENLNMEIKLSSVDNVRVEVEFQDENSNDEAKENFGAASDQNHSDDDGRQSALRENSKKRLQRLGKLYAGGDDANLSSPIHRTEATFVVQNDTSGKSSQDKACGNPETEPNVSRGRKGLGGLAALAKNIDQWEDTSSTQTKKEFDAKPLKRPWKPPAPRPPLSGVHSDNLPVKFSSRANKPQAPRVPAEMSVETASPVEAGSSPSKPKPSDTTKVTPKQLDLDRNLIHALESQGFTRTTSNTRLIYNYDSQSSPNRIKTAEISSPSKLGHSMKKECILEESEPEEPETPIAKSSSLTSINKSSENKQATTQSPVKNAIRGSAIANRAALFERVSSPSKSSTKDPALLSVSERKALFEKNKGAAPLPKAPISMAAPVGTEKVLPKTQNDGSKPKSPAKKEKTAGLNGTSRSPAKYPAPRPPIRPKDDSDSASAFRVAPGEHGGIASKMAALFQNKTTISQQQIENSIREQRQKEMDVLLNRFQKNKAVQDEESYSESESESENDETTETTAMINTKPAQIIKTFEEIPPPPPPPGSSGKNRKSGGKRRSKGDSPKVAAVLDDVKRIKVMSANKPGRLYPCLSDIETATETETEIASPAPTSNNSSFEESCSGSDAGMGDTSFGRDVLQTVCKNQSPQKRPIYDETTESDMSDILDEKDDYLDEALAYEAINKSGPTPPKHGRSISPVQPSDSFHYKNFSPLKASPQKGNVQDFKTPSKVYSSRKSDELPVVIDGDKELPLTHTVSFYRRQQTQESKTPVRQIIRSTVIEEPSRSTAYISKSDDTEVQNKIQELLEEMTRQQTIISQTSQALNLCYSTPEFTGSTEQVEAEKVLLLATHRRAAAQREMERLTVLKTLHPEKGLEKGTLTISNMILPLKRDYVRALNATGGKGHHVVCLIKCSDQVLSTKLVSTVATNDRNPNLELAIPGTINLKNISSNFTVQFEVYCLQAQEEVLPHEVKYHINNKKSNAKMTPKKGKADSRLIRPLRESPGGPQAVRSPTFALMGYVVFSLQAINRKNWTLNNAPSMSPLEGIVEMRVKCEITVSVEYRGFLTMFEDVSGFGAWHRRWCMLRGNALSYWKYPDDEKKKAPIDTIDLTNCITQQVGSVRRDICARLHTILIETTRLAQPQDKDSLIMECRRDTTVIRHLLSADTKEERIEWCTMLNKALTAVRMCANSK